MVKLWRLSASRKWLTLTAAVFTAFLHRDTAWSDGIPVEVGADDRHWDRVLEADLKYPILVRVLNGEMYVVDGFHRIIKAFLLGKEFLDAVDVSDLMEQCLTMIPEGYVDVY